MYERFAQLLKDNSVSAYRVSKATGIATSTLSDWKKGRSIPKSDKLQKIADYFGVTIDFIMSNTPFKNKLEEKHSIAVAAMKYIRYNEESTSNYFFVEVPEYLYTNKDLEAQRIYCDDLYSKYSDPNIKLSDLEYFEVFSFGVKSVKYDSEFPEDIYVTDNGNETGMINLDLNTIPKITLDVSKSKLFKLMSHDTHYITHLSDVNENSIVVKEEALPYQLKNIGVEYIDLLYELKDGSFTPEEIRIILKAAEAVKELKK